MATPAQKTPKDWIDGFRLMVWLTLAVGASTLFSFGLLWLILPSVQNMLQSFPAKSQATMGPILLLAEVSLYPSLALGVVLSLGGALAFPKKPRSLTVLQLSAYLSVAILLLLSALMLKVGLEAEGETLEILIMAGANLLQVLLIVVAIRFLRRPELKQALVDQEVGQSAPPAP